MKTLLLIGIVAVVLGTVFVVRARAEALAIGVEGPRPAAVDQEGKAFDWAGFYGSKFALVYFYPKADTPGCTKQACSLRDAYETLLQRGVKVVGVSGDKPEAQAAFREKYKLPFALIADPEGKTIEAFGVPRMGAFAARQAFLFKEGKLVWRDLKAATEKQAADVIAAIENDN